MESKRSRDQQALFGPKKFLPMLDKQVPAELDVHLICDN